MTDRKSLDPGQPDQNTRPSTEENGQLNFLGDIDAVNGPAATSETRKSRRPARGLRRPRAATGSDNHSDDGGRGFFRPTPSASSSQPDNDRSQPTGISDLDDVLDRDILFKLISTPMLDDESLHATVQDVESSLSILADDESDLTHAKESKSTEISATETVQNDPLVLVKRRRTGQAFADQIPAPLPVEDHTTPLSPEKNNRTSVDPTADYDVCASKQAIEDVAHDAVQMMSRSIDAAGGNVLNLELAREIRLHLTELLSEWQIEQLGRGELKDNGYSDGHSPPHPPERKSDLSETVNTYQFRPRSD